MESSFYESLLKHFIQVAWKVSPEVAKDEDRCREILHDRVFNTLKIQNWSEVEEKILGISKEFATPNAYANYLFTVFKNAILDELRQQTSAKKRSISIEYAITGDRAQDEKPQQEQALGLAVTEEPSEPPEKLREISNRIFFALGREKRRLLSLRVTGEMKLEECASVLGISKSSVDRHAKAVFNDLEGLLAKEGKELSEKDLKDLISLLLLRIDQEFDDE
ncbi:MAG TPA: sigma-70 family RNA polymerase sigma factor [bacterium]|nr:sigma-70 family RNA polymerase sigma factor [bacterium]